MKSKKPATTEAVSQRQRFLEAARDAGAEMTKEKFAHVVGGLAKPRPEGAAEQCRMPLGKDND